VNERKKKNVFILYDLVFMQVFEKYEDALHKKKDIKNITDSLKDYLKWKVPPVSIDFFLSEGTARIRQRDLK